MEDKVTEKKSLLHRLTRILLLVFVVVLALLIALVLAINIPAVQTFIAGKIIKSIREKTKTELSIGSVKIAFPNTVQLNELFIRDKNADTMLYMHSLHVDVDLLKLLSNTVSVNSLELETVVANIHRKEGEKAFNFQFLVDVFAPDTTQKPDTTEIPGKPWVINLKDISLKNIHATFIDARSGFDGRFNLGFFEAGINKLDLDNSLFALDEVFLKNTSVHLVLSESEDYLKVKIAADSIAKVVKTPPGEDAGSIFLGMGITANQLMIENTSFSLDNTGSPRLSEGIDYQHLHINNLNTLIRSIRIDSVGYKADIINMSLTESCGFNLKKLAADAQLTNQYAELKNLRIETNTSNVSADISLGYSKFNDFLSDIGNSKLWMEFRNSNVHTDDVFMFAPDLAANKIGGKFKHSDIFLKAKAEGKINDIDLGNLEISVLQNTELKTHGRLTGLLEEGELGFDATIDHFATNMKEINMFVDPAVFNGLNLPPSFELQGTVKGKTNSLLAGIQLQSAYGNFAADAFYQDPGNKQPDTFNIDFTAQQILAGLILSDTLIGKTSFTGKAAGSGIASGTISGSVILDIQEARYNNYTYTSLHIESQMDGKIISASASSADTNLNFKLIAKADMREAKQKYSATMDLSKLNLYALNFMDKQIDISTNLTADIEYEGLNNLEADIRLVNTTLTSKQKTIPVKELNLKAKSAPDSIVVELRSDLADGIVSGNINPGSLQMVLQSAYRKYFGLTDSNQVQPGKHLAFNIDVHIPQNIIDELVPDLDTLRISKLEGIYNSNNNELETELRVPEIIYSGTHLDSLSLVIKGEKENLAIDFRMGKLLFSSMMVKNLRVEEQINKGKISSDIRILDSLDKPRYQFTNEIEVKDNLYKIWFVPNGLILDGLPWTVEEGNMLEKHEKKISTQNFVFSNSNQSIRFEADDKDRKLSFTNFALQNLINIVEMQGLKDLIKGNLEGEVNLPVTGNLDYINATLGIDSLYLLDSLAGNLVFNLKTANDKMTVEAHIVNEENKISVNGDMDHLSGTPTLNLDVLIDINNLQRIEQYSFGALSEMKGMINAEISLKGTPQNPDINGFVGFEKTGFKVNSLNLLAHIDDEKIQLTSKGIHFDDFVIADEQGKKLKVEGDVLSSNFSDFKFDLHILTKDFQPINSTSTDNKLFYGKLSIATDIWFKGDIKNPDIEAQIKIDSATNLTYALPGSELKLVTSEGIVDFMAPGQIYDSIYIVKASTSLADSIMSQISGINLAVNLEIDPNARFTVDIDPKSGDYLTIRGSANLKINSDGSGKQSINGVYEVKSGLYQLSFYNLVKKTFTIQPGSTVTWSGNPKDAELNISASYVVTTPSTALMASESVSLSEAELNMFKQRLPYGVKLNILGFLSEPKISFNITLPDKYLTANPMVASKLSVLNSEEYTDELNKQVFALLVTGGFIPDNTTSTGGSPSSIASTAARNSVNGILAGQMNNVTSKYVHNFDVNFGLTTFDDGTTGSSDPTTELDVQVSKKLFNERVTIEAQSSFDLSGNKNPTTTTSSDHNSGEVAVTYKLTEDGGYKLKAFSQTAYDLFDGDIISSGVAILFTKEFDSLKRKKKVDSPADIKGKQSTLENRKGDTDKDKSGETPK